MESTSQDPINKPLPCECGNENHEAGLIINKWGDLIDGISEDKVKIQIFDGDEMKSVVVKLSDLKKRLGDIEK